MTLQTPENDAESFEPSSSSNRTPPVNGRAAPNPRGGAPGDDTTGNLNSTRVGSILVLLPPGL
jgi:hypothetical protein